MTERFDAVCARKDRNDDSKTYYTKIGAAFPLREGGWVIRLSALPVPDGNGEVSILLFEPKERDDSRGGGYGGGGGKKGGW